MCRLSYYFTINILYMRDPLIFVIKNHNKRTPHSIIAYIPNILFHHNDNAIGNNCGRRASPETAQTYSPLSMYIFLRIDISVQYSRQQYLLTTLIFTLSITNNMAEICTYCNYSGITAMCPKNTSGTCLLVDSSFCLKFLFNQT